MQTSFKLEEGKEDPHCIVAEDPSAPSLLSLVCIPSPGRIDGCPMRILAEGGGRKGGGDVVRVRQDLPLGTVNKAQGDYGYCLGTHCRAHVVCLEPQAA